MASRPASSTTPHAHPGTAGEPRPRDVSDLVRSGSEALRAGRPAEAISPLEQATLTVPAQRTPLLLLGTAYYRMGQYQLAVQAFRTLSSRDPGDADAHYSLGVALQAGGDLGNALMAYALALHARPDFERAAQRAAALRTVLDRQPAPTASTPPTATERRSEGAAPDPIEGRSLAQHLDAPGEINRTGDTRGRLLVEGNRQLRDYAGRAAGALTLAGTGLVLLTVDVESAARSVALRLGSAGFHEETLRTLRDNGADGIAVRSVERQLANASESAANVGSAVEALATFAAVGLVVAGVLLLVHAVLSSHATHYAVYQHRIDVMRGVVRRRLDSVRLYEVTDVSYRQPLWLRCTGDAALLIETEQHGTEKLQGFRDARFLRGLYDELRDASLAERRTMRKWWV